MQLTKIITSKFFYLIMGFLFVCYLYSFFKYLTSINDQSLLMNYSADIVVLTGGSGRIKTAIRLLSKNNQTRLLISGVGAGVKKSDILKDLKLDYKRIDLGYDADSTRGNALEAMYWVKRNNIKEIILVSDNWHLPRAKLLFKSVMPNIKIVPYSVFEMKKNSMKNFGLSKNILFLFLEHMKLIISHFQAILLRMYL